MEVRRAVEEGPERPAAARVAIESPLFVLTALWRRGTTTERPHIAPTEEIVEQAMIAELSKDRDGDRRKKSRCAVFFVRRWLGSCMYASVAPGRKHEVPETPQGSGTPKQLWDGAVLYSSFWRAFAIFPRGWMPWISQSAWVTDWHLGLSVRSRRARNKAAACTSVISYGTLRDKPVRSYGTVLIVQPDTSCTDGLVDDGQYWTVLNCFPVRNSASLNPITGWWTVLDSN